MREACTICGIRPRQNAGVGPNGKRYYKKKCRTCQRHPNLGDKAKITTCSSCMRIFHPVQIDIDHIDPLAGDEYENLQVLCACCHRIKTHLYKDNTNKKYRKRKK